MQVLVLQLSVVKDPANRPNITETNLTSTAHNSAVSLPSCVEAVGGKVTATDKGLGRAQCTPWQSIPCHSPAAFCAAYLQASGQLPLPSCQLLQQLLQCVHSQLPPFHLWLSSPAED